METVQNTPEKKLKGKHMTSAKPGSKLMNCNPIPNLDLFLKIPVMFWAQNQIFKSKSIEYKA